jgi:UDP-glucose 4-epimerase
MRTIVTGAGGFLGSRIASYLGEKGHKIAAVGRFSTLPGMAEIPNLWKLCGMTLPDRRFEDAVHEFQPTLVVHCAGTASVADSVCAPYVDFHRTAEVCAYVLETLRKLAPGCHFILLSSAAVYGNPRTLPVAEDSPLCPISPYGYHKVICEQLAEEYRLLHGIPSTVLRIFSAYGEGLRRQVVHDLFQRFADQQSTEVEIFGTGEETRDFIHVEDVARIVELIAKKGVSGIFNAASGNETTVRQLVTLISSEFMSSKKIVYNGVRRPGDPVNWLADVSRLSAIGFRPAKTLQEGIAAYKKWYLGETGVAE